MEEVIRESIEIHRKSREVSEGAGYDRPSGPPTDEEIDDFIASNPDLDPKTQEQLLDPGFLGFHARSVRASAEWIAEFRELSESWSSAAGWLAANLPWREPVTALEPEWTSQWEPTKGPRPGWIDSSPSALLLASDLLKAGRLLSEMSWRRFEELIGELLQREGWVVEVTRGSRDGGIDVVATKRDPTLGDIRSIWQAKKRSPTNKVRLSAVRELSGILDRDGATKGIVVTTSSLTKGAMDWIRRDQYRLAYKDRASVERWISRVTFGRLP